MNISKTVESILASNTAHIAQTILASEAIHLAPQTIPDTIKSWASSVVGKRVQKFQLYQAQEVDVDIPWHEADTEYYQLFKITPTGVQEATLSFQRSGNEGPWTGAVMEGKSKIPSGYIMAIAGTYPPRVSIYTADDAQKFLPQTKIDLTDDEAAILYWAKSLKSFARPILKEQLPYQTLIQKGLLDNRKAITIDGRNIINQPEIKQQLKNVADKYLKRELYLKNPPSYSAFNNL